jgi:hypothetical protein
MDKERLEAAMNELSTVVWRLEDELEHFPDAKVRIALAYAKRANIALYSRLNDASSST